MISKKKYVCLSEKIHQTTKIFFSTKKKKFGLKLSPILICGLNRRIGGLDTITEVYGHPHAQQFPFPEGKKKIVFPYSTEDV
jgi:hypothetical protein